MIDGDFLLEPYGCPGGVVIHTPGHTAGSVSAMLPNGDVSQLAGATSRQHRACPENSVERYGLIDTPVK